MKNETKIIFSVSFFLLWTFAIHILSFTEGFNTSTDIMYTDVHKYLFKEGIKASDLIHMAADNSSKNPIIKYRYMPFLDVLRMDYLLLKQSIRNTMRLRNAFWSNLWTT